MKRFSSLIAIYSFFIFLSFAYSESKEVREIFQKANQAFDQGDYLSATENYKKILQNGLESADLHFNLGNSYFKANSLGKAIFHYRKALEFSPRDPDIQFNFEYAKEKVIDQIENKNPFLHSVFSFLEQMSEKEVYLLFLFFFLSFVFFGIFHLYKKRKEVEWLRNGAAISSLVFFVLILYHSSFRYSYAVTVEQETKIYSSIGKDNVVLFTLHEGVEIRVQEQVGDWVRISLLDGKQGWTTTKSLYGVAEVTVTSLAQ